MSVIPYIINTIDPNVNSIVEFSSITGFANNKEEILNIAVNRFRELGCVSSVIYESYINKYPCSMNQFQDLVGYSSHIIQDFSDFLKIHAIINNKWVTPYSFSDVYEIFFNQLKNDMKTKLGDEYDNRNENFNDD
jgi:hypothetical protein